MEVAGTEMERKKERNKAVRNAMREKHIINVLKSFKVYMILRLPLNCDKSNSSTPSVALAAK
ncbi:MAG: hypothetical protein DHS20C08_07710 [Rhodomicrobium sp.]|nr:MAG: hypothetical protein DHS20C08_07710 [Rhodomicrobium sp.]